ncbi:MAG: DUF805 domain-containing protein [Lentisphaeria bacterium]|nr:DUF805 domain-containing protein [Lentisphaeria bacterium]
MQYQAPNPQNAYNQGQKYYPPNPNPPNTYNQGQQFYPPNSNPHNAYNQGHQFSVPDDNIANVEAFGCYLKVLKHYADFSGRASRKEYWFFVLFNCVIAYGIGFLSALMGVENILGLLYMLATLIPSIAVCIRRLHDINKSGSYFLIILIPIVGGILLVLDYCKEGTMGPNQYGNDPYGARQPPPTVPPMP